MIRRKRSYIFYNINNIIVLKTIFFTFGFTRDPFMMTARILSSSFAVFIIKSNISFPFSSTYSLQFLIYNIVLCITGGPRANLVIHDTCYNFSNIFSFYLSPFVILYDRHYKSIVPFTTHRLKRCSTYTRLSSY